MLRAIQQTVRVGTGGKIELVAPECPEGADVQVIVLLATTTQVSESETVISPPEEEEQMAKLRSSLAKIQNRVRQYVPEGESLVDELIAERRAEANCE
ncbi:hypothetical protein [Nodularia chucula]|uniref:hypothetical protein n=1 Tax=Nodularia chucula TaxID=3093667 RepID=UPI0039C5CB16